MSLRVFFKQKWLHYLKKQCYYIHLRWLVSFYLEKTFHPINWPIFIRRKSQIEYYIENAMVLLAERFVHIISNRIINGIFKTKMTALFRKRHYCIHLRWLVSFYLEKDLWSHHLINFDRKKISNRVLCRECHRPLSKNICPHNIKKGHGWYFTNQNDFII